MREGEREGGDCVDLILDGKVAESYNLYIYSIQH